MFITHRIKSELSIFAILVIYFHCVPEVVVPSYALYFINVVGNLGFVSFIAVQSYEGRK